MSTARNKAERDLCVTSSRMRFAKMLVRTEDCERSRSYKRKVRQHGSRARRRVDAAVIREELNET